jgi:homocysteine S-methyltransferase
MAADEAGKGIASIQVGHRKFVIGDGAMATYLHQCGVPIRVCAEELNLSSPHIVEQVHRAYVNAGATVIQTNSFAANRSNLSRYDLADKVDEVNQAAVAIARQACADQAAVFGTIGAIRGTTRYGGALLQEERVELQAQYEEQAKALMAAGIDGWVLETFPDLEEISLALEVVRNLSNLPVVANLSPEEVGVTRDGVPLQKAFSLLREGGADVTGLNCRLGPYGILRAYERLTLQEGTFAAVPNAGMLHRSETEGLSYTGDEDYFSDLMIQIAKLGVTWLGGCCGTTPLHIQTLVQRLKTLDTSEVWQETAAPTEQTTVQAQPSKPDTGHMYDIIRPTSVSLVEQVNAGTTIIVELDPPKTLNCERYIQGARALSAAGADMITMADNSLAMVRMSNMALASMLKQFGIEPLVHVACRDRNLIGQQSHLMGLHALGIRNILLVTGDPSKYGDLPGATSVYDVSSTDLTKMVRRLNEGVGFSGSPLRKPAEFVIGTSFNPHVRNFEKAVERLKRKVAAGADYVMTQPVYEERTMEQIAVATRDLGVPVMIGIMPMTGLRNAEFLHHQVPGITIPDEVLTAMREAAPEDAPEVGFNVAKKLCEAALQYYKGIYLITPFLKYEITVRLTQHIRQLTPEPQLN